MTAETDLRQLFYARCRQLTRKLVTKTKNSPVFVVSYETAQAWPSHDKDKTYWIITVVDQAIKITSSKIHIAAVFHFLQAGLSVQRADTQVSVVNVSICPHLLCWNNVTANAHPLKLNLHLYKSRQHTWQWFPYLSCHSLVRLTRGKKTKKKPHQWQLSSCNQRDAIQQ